MPRWTEQDFENYNNRNPPKDPIVKLPVRCRSMGQEEGKESNPGRILVSVTCYVCRSIDPDNLCPKYFIDCCRYCEWLPDDTPEVIDLKVSQVKVKTKAEQKTVIEITTP